MIWKFATNNEPRDVALYRQGHVNMLYKEDVETLPAILQTSAESRTEALRHYFRLYLINHGLSIPKDDQRWIYINNKTDLVVDVCTVMGGSPRFDPDQEFNQVHKVGLDYNDCCCKLEDQISSLLGDFQFSRTAEYILIARDYDAAFRSGGLDKEIFKQDLTESMKSRVKMCIAFTAATGRWPRDISMPRVSVDWRSEVARSWGYWLCYYQRYTSFDLSRCVTWSGN